MFERESIKVLHIESTTICNAACPQCARENPALYNDKIDRCTLSLDQIKELFDIEFIKQLDKVFACGDFGDPAASHETLTIFEFFRSVNPTIELGMNTNGGIQNTKWWERLGNVIDFCVFSIDGLEDTNHIYRKNVNFSKVIKNAEAFIKTGASAHWDMLVFNHNEHQVDKCLNLADKLGFTWFRAKVSKRFKSIPVAGLDPPKNFKLLESQDSKKIKCHALEEKSLYVAATGEIYPCCWIGNKAFSKDQELITMLQSQNYNLITDSWKKNPYAICKNNCSVTTNNQSIFEQQWFRNVQLR
jgi:hypothetical protein